MSKCADFDLWLGRANIQEFVLKLPKAQGGTPITDLTSITRAVLTVGGYQVDSATAPTAIWWSDSETRTIPINGADVSFTGEILKVQAGPEFNTAGLTAGTYDDCCLVVYDADHVEGAVQEDGIRVNVIDVCAVS